ncbi:EamA family transporter [Lactobacillus delbrueckii subsp. lactis]|nr:EamA family transporter [Lactobacillus delbrueckii]MCD5545429.1 EamA family transporter [Lactobacillus delbrueckii subsp. lactis]MCD5565860.1 EamA family transporter [Lactobacillus delbrueckii subsp. lactis]MCD5583502.1 EamA family transporter [Lactobacillus delbrueckii subsp. lactis]MCD5585421.1 EamA family transporter [Lactobacillus delbrueckii subsp. lactis]MCD5587353.1 EamA family transporter [Lactobacillus delbrueckii subsp. lactis]
MKDKHLGILLAITGAALWGTSETAAEMLYQSPNINTFWLVDVRSWLAGASLLLISLVHNGKGTFAIFKNPRDLLYAAPFSMLGITGAQFTYFYTVAASSAPTATVLVFLAPVLIICFMAAKTQQMPRRIDLIAVLLAVVGTVVLVTNGNFSHLAVTPKTLVWGFFSALTQALAIAMPAKLFKKYGTITILAWGMLLGGIILSPALAVMPATGVTVNEWSLVIYIVIAGTVFAYSLYLSSVMYNLSRPGQHAGGL